MQAAPLGDGQTEPDQAREEVRALVHRLWTEIIGSPPLPGVSLLAQGGDSLLATQLALRLSREFGLEVPIRSILETNSAETLSRTVEALRAASPPLAFDSLHDTTDSERVLSFSEERMWFMHAIAPQSAAYNIFLALRLVGPLNVTALHKALALLVQRHAILRCNYFSHVGGVTSVTQPHRHPLVTEISLEAGTHSAHAEQQIREQMRRIVTAPFDLTNEPLLRIGLIHLGADEALLVLVVHHIIGDQWSFDILSRELAQLYEKIVAEEEPSLPALPVDYRRYAAWHRRWFRHARESRELTYWRERLNGLEPVTFHPDHPRPPQKSFRGARVRLDFDPELMRALRDLGVASGATLAMVMLAAIKALLYRHAGSSDIGVGVPIANRNHPLSGTIVGTLLNTLVLRTHLESDTQFRTLLERVRDACLEAYDHQDMPFEQLIRTLRLPRDSSRSPLFGVMFNMLNTPLGKLDFKALKWSRFEFDRCAAQFDITITVDAEHDRSIVLEYATDIYTEATARRIAAQYMAVLRAIVDRPQILIAELPLISEKDRARIVDWSTGPRRKLENDTVSALIDTAFVEHAEAPALTCGSTTISYEELDHNTRFLAHLLRQRGIGRGQHVGLCLPRSISMLVAQLAVLRAGAAWVPLDPAYPVERLAHMAQDADLELLITESALADRIPWPGYASLHIDGLPADQPSPHTQDWDRELDPCAEDPAYIIYTSGSTGSPKGVVVPHGAVCNFLASMAREPGIGRQDRLLAVTTLSFDIAVLELLLPLSVGAQVVLAEQPDLTDGHRLIRLMERHAITVMQATPSTWRMLLEAGWRGCPTLRVLVGGESLPPELASALSRRSAEVWNMYGPTETTVWSTCWRVDGSVTRGRISLGAPIDNTRLHVLDSSGQPCPIGVPGEICIGGAGLATGYYKRPDLDSERFFPNPFEGTPGTRLYRTGDLARWTDDGHLQHMGRLDHQVKVRGHRIELGEIEGRLTQHPELAGNVVLAREDRPGDVRLIAYAVPWDRMPEPVALRTFLRERLPDYMVPQHFVELDAIPLLPNGKVNRARLPAASAHLVGTRPRAPRNDMEDRLADLWREILGIEELGIADDFFDLGGHSMLAVRLVGRIRDELAVPCTLPMLFRNPTIEQLARALLCIETSEDAGELVPLQALGDAQPLFCLCGIQLYRSLAKCFAPERPVFGVFVVEEMAFLDSSMGADRRSPGVVALAARYVEAIRANQPGGPYHLVGFSFGGVLAYEVAQQLRAADQQIGLLAIIDSDVPGHARYRFPFRLKRHLRRLVYSRNGRHHVPTMTAAPAVGAHSTIGTEREPGYLATMRAYDAQPYDGEALFFEALLDNEETSFGWLRLVRELEIYRLPGDHLSVLQPPLVDTLAAVIQSRLTAAR